MGGTRVTLGLYLGYIGVILGLYWGYINWDCIGVVGYRQIGPSLWVM